MLAEIRIESLGAISSATAEFDRGLTVLTGETGTGKTMVVTSLHLLGGIPPWCDPITLTFAANRRLLRQLWVRQKPDSLAPSTPNQLER